MNAMVLDIRDQVKGKRGKVIKEMVEMIRNHQLSYDEFIECSKIAREQVKLERPGRKPVNKPVPSIDDIKKFMAVVEKQSPKHGLMMKLLIYMGIRECELVRIEIKDLDLTAGAERIFVHRKDGRDKWFVLPEKITSLLRMYISTTVNQVYLFEPSFHKLYTERAIRKMIQKYREDAGVSDIIHAHNFRHMILTLLAGEGWSDHELQLVSGHDSRGSLDRYIYQNPELIRNKYNQALNQVTAGV